MKSLHPDFMATGAQAVPEVDGKGLKETHPFLEFLGFGGEGEKKGVLGAGNTETPSGAPARFLVESRRRLQADKNEGSSVPSSSEWK